MIIFLIAKKNKEIAIIVKSKNNKKLQELYQQVDTFNELLLSDRLIVVNNSKGIPPSDYALLADLVVGINADDIPSAVMECLIHCKKAIFYDYSNLKIMREIYIELGSTNLFLMILGDSKFEFENFIYNKHHSTFGNWDKLIDEIYSFKDYIVDQKKSRGFIKILFENLTIITN